MLTPAEYAEWQRGLDERRSKKQAQTVWPTPDDAGTGVVPVEIAPGRGDMNYSSGFVPTFPTALWLVGNRAVSFTRLFMSQPWVAAAVMRMLTWAVRVPLKVYRRDGEDPADRVRLRGADHPLAAAIEGIDRNSQAQLTMSMLGPVLVHGNSVTLVEQGAQDQIRLTEKDWRFCRPLMPFRDSIDGFQFDIDSPLFRQDVSVDEVLHVAWWSPTGPIGCSPLQQLGVTVQIEDAAQRTQRALFANGTRQSSAIIASPEWLGLDQSIQQKLLDQLREDMTTQYSGPDNSGRPILLPPGLTWSSVGQTVAEADLLEQRRVAREEVAAVYQIPPPLIGILDRATYSCPADTLVMTERGSRPIVDVAPGDRVWSLWEGRMQLKTAAGCRQTGCKPLVTVKTTNRTLRVTDNHPVLVARRIPGERTKRKARWCHEWVNAGELTAGDLLVTATSLPEHGVESCPTRATVSEGFVEFCGLLLGDGFVAHEHGIRIARGGEARYMNHYRDVMRAEFVTMKQGGGPAGTVRQTRPVTLDEQERETRFASRLASREMEELGLGGDARAKRVPDWVGALTPRLRAAFLRGFCDADGHVDKKGHLAVHSANELLLRQIRDLCIGVGVPVCNVYARRSWVTLPTGRKVFSVMWSFKAANPQANVIIGSHDPVDLERMRKGKPWGRKAYRYQDRQSVSPPVPDGCGAARVRSVERGEVSVPVYDIGVGESENFIAEGVLVHNSNIQTQRDMTYTDCLGPPLVLIESAINQQIVQNLLGDPELFVEYDFAAVLRGDPLQEIASIRDGIATALLTPNEGRSVLNRPKSADPGMDQFYLPFNNLQPVGSPPVAANALPGQQPFIPFDAPAQQKRLHVRSRDRDYEYEPDPEPAG